MTSSDRPLLVLHDDEEGHLVYDLLLVLGSASASASEEDPETQTLSCSCFPDPVACFPARLGCCAFAVSGGSLLGAFYDFWDDTLFHDTVMLVGGYDFWERQPSPRMRDSEGRLVRWWPLGRGFDVSYESDGYNAAPAMLPMGDGTVVRMDTLLFDGMYSFETLRLVPGDGGGWKWHATALPKPPVGPLAEEEIVFVSAYVAVGARVWISVTRRGTFSLDTRTGTWTAEGTWRLPFEGRALDVPEIDAVVGLGPAAEGAAGTQTQVALCACDVETGSPPVMRHLWTETLPWPWEERIAGDGRRSPDSRPRDKPSLAYLGKGTFCICRPMSTEEHGGPPITYDACSLVVEVGRLPSGELGLVRRGRMSYMCPPRGREWAYVGFIQPAI